MTLIVVISLSALLAGIVLLAVTVYRWLKKKPIIYTGIPMVMMLILLLWPCF